MTVALVLVVGAPGWVLASSDPSMTSSSFSVVESQLGANGSFNQGSTNFSLSPNIDDGGSSLGESTVGNSSSTNFQSNAGFNTTAQAGLSFVITSGNVNLGVLSTGSANTGTATFNVRDYTSSGYMVTMVGSAPSISGHTLSALASDTSSSPGTEQFGVNMVVNGAVPGSANASCQAAGFCFGVSGDGSTSNYIQTNKFRFNSGEVVASGPKSSGETDYTMSFLANMGTLTPAGAYQGNVTLIATGSY